MTILRFPVERVNQRKIFAADAVVVVMPKRERNARREDELALLCEESFRLVARSFDLLFDILRGDP
jgi:hypothetical protein